MPGGLEDYASPILRASVFRQLHPGAQITYKVVAIDEAFPKGYREYEGKAIEAVECEIVFPDGHWITAYKEIDTVERGKPVPATPENLAKNETKALGRALRDAGIPQRLSELKVLMQWIASMSGTLVPITSSIVGAPPKPTTDVLTDIESAFPGTMGIADEDSPDAGSEDPTPEQLLAKRFAFLNGVAKQTVVAFARDTLGVKNVLKAGEHAEELMAVIDKLDIADEMAAALTPDQLKAAEARNTERRQAEAATLEPEEEF